MFIEQTDQGQSRGKLLKCQFVTIHQFFNIQTTNVISHSPKQKASTSTCCHNNLTTEKKLIRNLLKSGFFGKTDIFGAIYSKVLSMIFSPKKIGEGGLSRKFGGLTGTVASRWLARFKLMPAGMKSQNVLTATLLNEFFPLAMGPLL